MKKIPTGPCRKCGGTDRYPSGDCKRCTNERVRKQRAARGKPTSQQMPFKEVLARTLNEPITDAERRAWAKAKRERHARATEFEG